MTTENRSNWAKIFIKRLASASEDGVAPPILEVPYSYLEDNFNFQGVSSLLPYKNHCKLKLLNYETRSEGADRADFDLLVQKYYFLCHARFVRTYAALVVIRERFLAAKFGVCPRKLCKDAPLLPCGESDSINRSTLLFFCDSCGEVYNSSSSVSKLIDGVAFGPSFPHLFFLQFPELKFKGEKVNFIRKINGYPLESEDELQFVSDL